jgi:hypothetical protein
MPLLDAGRDFIAEAIINDDTPAFFDNTNARLAVGDSDDAFDETDTDLQAVTNKFRKGMEASYPQRTANAITFRSLFSTSEANFAWEEWGVANDGSAGVLLNRKVESLGTKADTQSWQLTAEITIVNEDAV